MLILRSEIRPHLTPHDKSRRRDADSYPVTCVDYHDLIGIDTEFMREKTFFAQLCLVQIATPDASGA